MSLTELCVRSICRRLSELGSFPSELPREVVDALLDSLTQVRALYRRGQGCGGGGGGEGCLACQGNVKSEKRAPRGCSAVVYHHYLPVHHSILFKSTTEYTTLFHVLGYTKYTVYFTQYT